MRAELHYTLTGTESVAATVGVTTSPLVPRYNIAPGQLAPVAIERDALRVCEHLRWGLLPRWRGHGGKRGPLIHAVPLEAVAGTPLLRDAFKKQRCLVIADGCYAWRELNQPVWFHPEPLRPIAFAGVWSINDDDGVPSFAVLLGAPLVTRVNEAMPIVVPDASYCAWLDPRTKAEQATELLVDAPLSSWRSDLVSPRMSSKTLDDPACVAPVGNPNQGELF
jgi:putative SOS response-associated peptidase YedK